MRPETQRPGGAARRRVPPFLRDGLAVAGAAFLLLLALAGALAPQLGLQDPLEQHLTRQVEPPSAAHWLGTDSYGRDMLSRLVYGGRVSLAVGMGSVGLAVLLGVPIGLAAGYYRGWVDSLLMRLMDALMTFPPILLAIVLVGLLGPSTGNVVLGLGIVYTPRFARVTRASAISVRERDFVTAARAVGATDLRIMVRHMLPNVLGPVIVQSSVAYAFAIVAEAGMSFLGLGVQPPTPSWGAMLADAQRYITTSPHYAVFPGLALTLSVLAITLVGDRLRQVLDPRQRLTG